LSRHPASDKLGGLCEELSQRRIDDILQSGMHEFVDGLQLRLNAIGAAIHETYFDRRPREAALDVR
jgi:uncharacterized alpha-E superfamily protein